MFANTFVAYSAPAPSAGSGAKGSPEGQRGRKPRALPQVQLLADLAGVKVHLPSERTNGKVRNQAACELAIARRAVAVSFCASSPPARSYSCICIGQGGCGYISSCAPGSRGYLQGGFGAPVLLASFGRANTGKNGALNSAQFAYNPS